MRGCCSLPHPPYCAFPSPLYSKLEVIFMAYGLGHGQNLLGPVGGQSTALFAWVCTESHLLPGLHGCILDYLGHGFPHLLYIFLFVLLLKQGLGRPLEKTITGHSTQWSNKT